MAAGSPGDRSRRQRATRGSRGAKMRKIVDTILPTTMVGSYPRPDWFRYQLLGRDVARGVQARRARGSLCRCHPRDHPGPGGSRPRHRLRRPDVLRRLRRLDRLVLLVHVRAHPGVRSGQGGASRGGRRRDHDQGDHAALGLGRRGQQRPDRRQGDAASGRLLQARQALCHAARQGLGRRRAGQSRLARLFQALQGPARAVLCAGADLQCRR